MKPKAYEDIDRFVAERADLIAKRVVVVQVMVRVTWRLRWRTENRGDG